MSSETRLLNWMTHDPCPPHNLPIWSRSLSELADWRLNTSFAPSTVQILVPLSVVAVPLSVVTVLDVDSDEALLASEMLSPSNRKVSFRTNGTPVVAVVLVVVSATDEFNIHIDLICTGPSDHASFTPFVCRYSTLDCVCSVSCDSVSRDSVMTGLLRT